MSKKVVILGTGPCGLGAAWRLKELNHSDYKVFERSSTPGGLATSFKDEKGFTWDVGGHVHFSHYEYFDSVLDQIMKDDWLHHIRSSHIWLKNRFIPYPFQNNIHLLPDPHAQSCLKDLELAQSLPSDPKNFEEWILSTFGNSIAENFMFPYNFKVWAHPPKDMSHTWIGERVSKINIDKIKENFSHNSADSNWGPNSKFRYPLKGGTGEIWNRLYQSLEKDKIHFNHSLSKVDTNNKILHFNNGHKETYDYLISTLPLDNLIGMSDLSIPTPNLKSCGVHIFGIGLSGPLPEKHKGRCWAYFPESDCPFYRLTMLSNYSPNNVPSPGNQWSIMGEVSESKHKPVSNNIKEEIIQGLLNTKFISPQDKVDSFWLHKEEKGYPVPSLDRDSQLEVLKTLKDKKIYSRGRFGAWKYEISNQDHTFMQGVESINNILLNSPELTLNNPEKINTGEKVSLSTSSPNI
tara:strand:+ start:644 stop:2032 length:1389 start_codon:yes stop_codon:yes gene_type:complete